MKTEKDLFKMVIQDEDEDGLYALSLVNKPAMKSHWLALKEQKKIVEFVTMDTDKHVVMGAILVPDVPVYRDWVNPNTGDVGLYIYFDEDIIRKSHELMMKNNLTTFTIQHDEVVPNIHLLEIWMVEDTEKDKSAFYGMQQPKGTLMSALKVNNNKIWDDYIKTGELTGFSIEGMFAMQDNPADSLSENDFLSSVRDALTA